MQGRGVELADCDNQSGRALMVWRAALKMFYVCSTTLPELESRMSMDQTATVIA